LLGALTLAPALCALLIAGLGVARFALQPLALALSLLGLLVPVVLLLLVALGSSSDNALFVGLFGGSVNENAWFSAVYRIDGFGLYLAFGITLIIAPLLVWMAWQGVEGEVSDEHPSWAKTVLSRTQWGGVALALGIESTALTVIFADNILWLALAWLVLAVGVWGIGELGSDLDTLDRIGLALMLLGPLLWVAALLIPANGRHGDQLIYPRLTDMMGRSGLPPLQVLVLAIALTLAGAGYPFLVWLRRRALLVTPAGLLALAVVLLPMAMVVGARTYSAAQDANSSWQQIGQTAPPITAGIWFSILGMLTICVSGLLALGRRDSRTLIAYLAVAQVGWGLMALGAGDPTSMLGLIVLLTTGIFGLGAMLSSLFAGGTLTSDIEPDSAGPRPFGVPVRPISLVAWIVGALTLLGAPLFGGFVALQMISASIIHTRGLAVPLLGTAWAGDALLCLAVLRATAPAFTVFSKSGYQEDGARGRMSRIASLLPLAPAAILALLGILVGAVPQILLRAGGILAAGALVQAGAASAVVTPSTIGYQLIAAQWLPSVAWLAILVLGLVVVFALPASLRDVRPIFLAGQEERSLRADVAQDDEVTDSEVSSAELAFLPDPVGTWSDIAPAFTSSWLVPLGNPLLSGIDDEYPKEIEGPDEGVLEEPAALEPEPEEQPAALEPEQPAALEPQPEEPAALEPQPEPEEQPAALEPEPEHADDGAISASREAPSASESDDSAHPVQPASSQSKPETVVRKSTAPAKSRTQAKSTAPTRGAAGIKKAAPKKGGKGGGR
jgi:formate hydrogenlyase subunit 3/multisubunit Na+/H+ antiporter MnhD subunit